MFTDLTQTHKNLLIPYIEKGDRGKACPSPHKTTMRVNFFNIKLVKEKGTNYYAARRLDMPETVADFIRDIFNASELAEEHFWLICLDAKCNIMGVHTVTIGGVTESLAPISAIYKRALVTGAVSIIIAHNHLSAGVPEPSKEDFAITRKTKEAGALLEIPLLDHIIVSSDGYYSFRDNLDTYKNS